MAETSIGQKSDTLMTQSSIKLQAFLAHAGIASRRHAEDLITQGLVKVNDEPAHLGQRVTDQDKIEYQGQVVTTSQAFAYILINKPVGLVSTVSDELGRQTVMSLIPAEYKTERLYPVGRLDQESQGLMLLTNDGEVAYRFTHPKFSVPKTYRVELDRPPSTKAIEYLKRGVTLTDGPALTKELQSIGEKTFEMTITDGRNRQVRRMWQRVGYEVTELTRTAFGPFSLEEVPEARFKVLNAEEITQLQNWMKMLK